MNVGDLLHLSYDRRYVRADEAEVDVVVTRVWGDGDFDVSCADQPEPWTITQGEIGRGDVVVTPLNAPTPGLHPGASDTSTGVNTGAGPDDFTAGTGEVHHMNTTPNTRVA